MRPPTALVLAALALRPAVAGTLDDMSLRDNIEIALHGNATTAALHLKVDVDDGAAVVAGRVRDLTQADAVIEIASKVRGIREIDRSGLRLEDDQVADDAIASGVVRTIAQMPKLGSSAIEVEVHGGVVTLTGSIKSAAYRGDVRRAIGEVRGVLDVADRLESPEAPDDKIAKVLEGHFSPRSLPRFPGAVTVKVAGGTVTLEGRVPRLFDRRTAERDAWEIDGVKQVDNRLELSGSGAVQVVRP